MNKPKAVVVVAIALIVLVLTVILLYFRGIGVNNDDFTVMTHKGATEDTQAITKQIVIKGDESLIRVTEGDSTSERGLKSYEIEDVQKQATRLNIRWAEPDKQKACDNLPEPESYLSIESKSRTGIVYFCEGIGADESGNIVGPYHDLLALVNDLEI